MPRLVLQKLSKMFATPGGAVRALTDINLDLSEKELLVLLGPSGSGKTTLLRILAGLAEPSAGTMSLEDRVLNGVPPEEREVAMVFQEPALYPHLNVHENLVLALKLRRVSKAERVQRVREAAELLGLTALLDRMPSALSGGERQRVALGRAMVLRPRLLLLDEPLSSLDAPLRAQLRHEIRSLHRRLGAIAIYVTHDQMEAMSLADRLVLIRDGLLQQSGPPIELYRAPANLFVARFVGLPPMNCSYGSLQGKSGDLWFRGETQAGDAGESLGFRLPGEFQERLAMQAGKRVVLGLRPEDVRLNDRAAGSVSEPVFEAVVEDVETLGWESHLSLKLAGCSFVARVAPECPASIGQKIRVAFELSKGHFFDSEYGDRLC